MSCDFFVLTECARNGTSPAMRRRHRHSLKSTSPTSGAVGGVLVLPPLATAEQIARVLQVTPRTVHYWADRGEIPTALRRGKVVRYHPPDVAAALGLVLPEFSRLPTSPNGDPQGSQNL